MTRLGLFAIAAIASAVGAAGWLSYTARLNAPAAVVSTQPASAGGALRIVEGENMAASCAAGETLVNAFCYSLPGATPSASGVSFRETEPGTITAACLSGGRKIRLVCMAGRP
jgi:hypothetical protein